MAESVGAPMIFQYPVSEKRGRAEDEDISEMVKKMREENDIHRGETLFVVDGLETLDGVLQEHGKVLTRLDAHRIRMEDNCPPEEMQRLISDVKDIKEMVEKLAREIKEIGDCAKVTVANLPEVK
jgi:hypothetical protein